MVVINNQHHISKAFDHDFAKINNIISCMIDNIFTEINIVKSAIQNKSNIEIDSEFDFELDFNNKEDVIKAVVSYHTSVIENEMLLEQEVIRVIALRNPVANDLKLLMVFLKISHAFRYISQHCRGAVYRSYNIDTIDTGTSATAIKIIKKVRKNMERAITLFTNMNSKNIDSVIRREADINKYYSKVLLELLNHAFNRKLPADNVINMILLMKNIEKIGDQVVHISHSAYDIATGVKYVDDI